LYFVTVVMVMPPVPVVRYGRIVRLHAG
jgi:hypothetical protein